jgi:hypothetical protein
MIDKKIPYEDDLSSLTKFRLFLQKLSLSEWMWLLSLPSLALLFLYIIIRGLIFTGTHATWVDYFVAAIVFFSWGCLGFLWAYRWKDVQVLGIIKGTPALITGIILMIACWGFTLFSLILGMTVIFGF